MRPKLLFVGDATLRKVWQVLFAGRGWQVASASTADEGLASLDPAPDYLILDLRRPDAGREAVLRRVRETGLRTRVTVLAAPDDAAEPDFLAELEPESLLRGPIDVARIWREGVLATAG
jgi:CheY-like chemotaxis protein